MTFGVASASASTIFTALTAAETTNATFDSEPCFFACSDGQCVYICTNLNTSPTPDVFEVYFRSSTAYATGVTISASTPGNPFAIASFNDFSSDGGYVFNQWWNPTTYSNYASENVAYVLGDVATFRKLMSTTSATRYEVGDAATFWVMVYGTTTAISSDHKSTAVTWAGSEMLQASTAAAIIALTSCLF